MSIILSLLCLFNATFFCNNIELYDNELTGAYILALDRIYNENKELKGEFIILDMESRFFVDISYRDREKIIDSFNKYNKNVLSASLFKLKEIGLANKQGTLLINADLLMFNNIYSNKEDQLVIEGERYKGELAIYFYRIILSEKQGKWNIDKIEELGVA